MLSWLFTLGGLTLSWLYTDLNSELFFYNTLCPILVALFLVVLLVKVVLWLGPKNGSGGGGGDGGGFFDGFGGD